MNHNISLKFVTYLMIIACLIGVNFLSLHIGVFKLSLYRVLIILSPLLILSLVNIIHREKQKGVNFRYIYLLCFWIVYSVLSILWVKDYAGWIHALTFLISGFLTTMFIFACIQKKEDIIKCLELVVVFSVFYFGFSFYEMITGNYLFLSEDNLDFYKDYVLLTTATGIRPPMAVFGNPNNYALFLFFSVVSSFLLYQYNEKKRWKMFYSVVVIVSVFLIVCSQSRSSFIGTCIFFILYALRVFTVQSIVFRIKAILGLVIVLLIIVPVVVENFDLFADVISVDLTSASEGSSDAIRKNLIKNGFDYLHQTFFLGVGLGNIEFYMKNFPIYYTGDIFNMHNWWLEIIVSSGIFVFAFYIFTYFGSLHALFKRLQKSNDPKIKSIYSTLFCFFFGLMIASIGASSLIDSEWYWALMAIFMKASTIKFSQV